MLILALLSTQSAAYLKVMSPEILSSKFISKSSSLSLTDLDATIANNYANFGYIPYGHSIVFHFAS